MKLFKIILSSFIILFLIVLTLHLTKKAPIQNLSTSHEGMEIKIEQEVYTTSTKKIVIIIRNNSETTFTGAGGGKFPIEKFVAGSWYKVPFKNDVYTADKIIILPGGKASLYTQVNDLDAKLKPGKYRARYNSMAVPFEVKKEQE